jgi:hypothetical protein
MEEPFSKLNSPFPGLVCNKVGRFRGNWRNDYRVSESTVYEGGRALIYIPGFYSPRLVSFLLLVQGVHPPALL